MNTKKRETINREWLFRAVAEGQLTIQKEVLQRFFEQLDMPWGEGKAFCVEVAYADRDRAFLSAKQLPQLLNACIRSGKSLDVPVYSYIGANLNVMAMICAGEDYRQELAHKFFEAAQKKSSPLQMGIGRCYPMETVSLSRIEADEALFSIVPGEQLSDIDDIYAIQGASVQKREHEKQKIIDHFRTGKMDTMMNSLRDLAEIVRSESPVREGRPYPTSIRRTVLEVLVQIMHICAEAGLDVDKLLNNQDPYKRIFEMRSTPEILDWFADVTNTLYSSMDELSARKDNHLLGAVKQIIAANLNNPELSLHMVSQQVGITPTYLSAFFAREMGNGFNEHVTGLRIEKAKQLLLDTRSKINEIAESCGFRTASYFIRVFNKYVGMSPAAFRNTRK